MLALSIEYAISIILALAILMGFWGLGRTLWRLLFRQLEEDRLTVLIQFGLGAWLTWTVFFLLGLTIGYKAWPAYLILGTSVTIGSIQLIQKRTALRATLKLDWQDYSAYEKGLVALCVVIALLAVIGALTPPSSQDALIHHLALPKELIKAGQLVEFPYNYFSYFPSGMEMLFLYGLLLHGAGTATLLHLSFGLATFTAILVSGRAMGLQRRTCLIAATAFLSVPTVWMEMTWAYIDLALTFYITLAVFILLRFRAQRASGWIWLHGFALGGALSLKYTALILLPIVSLLILLILREHKETGLGAILRNLVLPMLIMLLVSCPWFIRNAIQTGNPLFPFLLNIIPSHNPGWDVERAALFLAAANRYGSENKTILDYLLVPFRLSFLARYESIRYHQGIIGAFYIFSLPLLLWTRRIRFEIGYLLGFAITFYLFWLFASQQIRYLLPVLPALALAIAASDELFATKVVDNNNRHWQVLHTVMLALVMLIFVINLGIIGYYFNNFNYGNVFLGRISETDYLRSKFDYYNFYEYINANTPSNSRIFLINASNQPYYLERDYFSDSVFEDYTLTRIVSEARSPEEIKARLQAMGITHILYRPYLLFSPDLTRFSAEQQRQLVQFLQQHCKSLLRDQRFALFAIEP
ncbi:MAG: phospholipid carrier-dependent glycosyltransferase [Acidobacteriota bacterium]